MRLATILCLEFIPTGYKGMLMLGDKLGHTKWLSAV